MSDYRIVGGDSGTLIVFTVREWPIGTPPVQGELAPVVNMATATNIKLILIPPYPIKAQGQTELTVTATLYTDGSDGKIQYTTVSGDIPNVPTRGQSQLWRARAKFTLSGWAGESQMDSFWVDP